MKLNTGLILTIIGMACAGGAWLWSVAGQAQHNADTLKWCADNEGWTEIQLANVAAGRPIDWKSKPR